MAKHIDEQVINEWLPWVVRTNALISNDAKVTLVALLIIKHNLEVLEKMPSNHWFYATNKELTFYTGIKSDKTLYNIRRQLQTHGYIESESGGKNTATSYHLNMKKLGVDAYGAFDLKESFDKSLKSLKDELLESFRNELKALEERLVERLAVQK